LDITKVTNLVSIEFAVFVIISLVFYYLVPGKFQNLVLLLLSWFFYALFPIYFLATLIFLIVFNFLFAKFLDELGANKNIFLWLGIIVNVALILVFKYFSNYSLFLDSLFGSVGQGIWNLKIVLPVGLSFYVLQAISYLVDVYNQKRKPVKSFILLSLYLSYFPKLLSGPIEPPGEFISQLTSDRVVDNQRLSRAVMLIVMGVFKKVVVATSVLSLIPQEFYEEASDLLIVDFIYLLFAYGLYLYADFSGYTNLMRGVSELFGITLQANFKRPLFTASFTDFWGRWHISLSTWLKIYIYLPFSRYLLRKANNKRVFLAVSVPLLITMLASAMWHNISVEMLLWGLGFSVFLIIEAIPRNRVVDSGKRPWWERLVFWSLSLLFGLLFAIRLDVFLSFLSGVDLSAQTFVLPDVRLLLLGCIILWVDWVQEKSQNEFVLLFLDKKVKMVLLLIVFFSILVSSQVDTIARFVYEGF
jgi:D-alanyl-lipoteichoic acid acyltransferase DltB (MBOAT superfamily)